MRNESRELEMNCQVNKESTKLIVKKGSRLPTWYFECSNATIIDSRHTGYDVTCKRSQKTCPIYLHLLRQADEEYEAIKSKN